MASHLESLGFEVERPGRDPAWAEEELILALDLYLRAGSLDAKEQAVTDLSRDLNALTVHAERPDEARVRDPISVAQKLANFAALDPNHSGRGITRDGKRDSEVWDRYASNEDGLYEAAAAIRQGRGSPTAHSLQHSRVQVVETDVEAQNVEEFQVVPPDQVIEANRREQTLVRAYQAHLTDQGHCVKKNSYKQPGYRSPLSCDLIDATDQVLYEAKGDVRRESVRMAIGQLFDYRQFEPGSMSFAVLLPRKPTEDLIELLHSVGVSAVWRTADGFAESQPQIPRIRGLGADEVPRSE